MLGNANYHNAPFGQDTFSPIWKASEYYARFSVGRSNHATMEGVHMNWQIAGPIPRHVSTFSLRHSDDVGFIGLEQLWSSMASGLHLAPDGKSDTPKGHQGRAQKKHKWALLEGRRILIVEDEALQALLLAQMIIGFGAHVAGVATSIPAALAEISTKSFDCATLDLNMEGMFSLGMAKGLRDMGIPFVFCTAYGHIIREFAGAPVVQKPVSEEALAAALIEAITGKSR
jgi:CheY-like chemotaxis protein